jgi:arginyl-tRNA synthetase
MDIRRQLLEVIKKVLQDVGLTGEIKPVLEVPSDISHGDYATSAALQYAKILSMAPRVLADNLNERLAPMVSNIAKTEVAGHGFINFRLAPDVLATSLQKAVSEDMWGANSELGGKKIMVEYTDPNPFKEFHIGHLMSNAIGESIARLFQFSGAEVKRANWQGDVGPHVAKAIWGKMQKPELSWGEAYAYGSGEYENHKEEIDALNKKIYEKSDEEVNRLYTDGRAASLAHFEELYAILGTKFDYYFFEGTEGMEGVAVVKEFLQKGVFEESDGAVVFKGEPYGLHTRVFLTSKGLPTYEAKELGLNKAKFEKEPDLNTSIIITASEQSDYFKVVLKAMEMIFPAIAAKTTHISHGMMRFAEGKMSSRTGNVITGESLLNDLIEAAKERAAESRADDHAQLAQDVAVAAIKYQILRQQSSKDIIFDRERALSLEGDSGPYLQYAHARAQQIVEKAKEQGVAAKINVSTEPDNLTRLLHRFPEIVEYAASLREPHVLTSYLLEIASTFNSWYAQVHILDGSADAPHKVALADAVRKTLKNGLWMLGIPAPERM